MQQSILDMKKEIEEVLALPVDHRRAVYQDWAQSGNAEKCEKCFMLAMRMRKMGNKREAFAASEYLTEKAPSLKSYNIYLASAYDLTMGKELSFDDLENIFLQAIEFYMGKDFEPNITATLLKTCNLLLSVGKSNRETFEKIYQKCPDEFKRGNSFIAAQYLKRLIGDKRRQKAIQEYESLLPEVRTHRSIVQIMKQCELPSCGLPPLSSKEPNIRFANAQRVKRITLITDHNLLEKLSSVLSAFSFDLQIVDIQSEDLVEKLNQRTYKSVMALLVLTEEALKPERLQANWLFTIGYCVHKFSKNNIAVFAQNYNDYKDSNLGPFLALVNAVDYANDVTILTELGRRNVLAG